MHAASTLCGNASAASDAANGSSCYLLDPSCDPQAHFFADAQYNRYRPPSVYTDAEGEPTVVYFQLFIQSAFYACPVNQELYFASQMEYSWLDARLNLSLLVDGQRTSPLPEGLSDRLWRPRLAFSPVTKLSPLDSQADRRLRFRVAPDNRIVASQRLNFALCCNIDYIYYPFDVHVCDMSIVNTDSDDHQSILRWIGDEQSPFRVSEKSIHFDTSKVGEGTFNFLGILPLFVVDDLPGGGRRTRLVVRAAFRRQLLAVLIDPLGPSLFPVLLSWTGFWLDPKRPVTRAALMALSFVILEHQQVSHFTSRAQDHQLRSIDVWYLICRCFIMAALLEYVLILHTADNLQDCSVPPSPPRGATSGVDVSSPASMATTAGGCGSSQAKLATSSATSPATSATAAGLARVVRLSPQETDDACKTFFPLAFLLASLLYAGAFAGPLLTSKDFAKLPVRYAE
ncbi:glycine receptor subunit alpha-2 isoform X1 [Rhipicephalus sanguineus]|uniref:glycine receptor subunit alpha-2 isoform X1 n=1 Tax=Rhipicephalus sanguineus TaxID=34632 RepID=UPI0020C45886|nr:glycine receptor subunit alpha-2 isoform X1 [Rhipicephalus sanguineus]